jgi:hypothetical protein
VPDVVAENHHGALLHGQALQRVDKLPFGFSVLDADLDGFRCRSAPALQLARRDLERCAPHPCSRVVHGISAAQQLRKRLGDGIIGHCSVSGVAANCTPQSVAFAAI